MTKALFPGSFDPFTLGHLDLVRRGARLFDALTIAIGRHAGKQPLFAVDERIAMIREVVHSEFPEVEVTSFAGLVVEAARAAGADCLLRGVRTLDDFESERAMAQMNRAMHPDLETVFLAPASEYQCVSSRLIVEIARGGGDVTPWVPASIARRLQDTLTS
jgi:pantetheine-phosphate adenylyltransferase